MSISFVKSFHFFNIKFKFTEKSNICQLPFPAVSFRFRIYCVKTENTIYTILRYIPVRGVFICNNVSKTIIPLLDRTHDQTLLMRSSDVLPVGFNFLADPVMIPAPRLNPFGRLMGAQTQLMITCSAAL